MTADIRPNLCKISVLGTMYVKYLGGDALHQTIMDCRTSWDRYVYKCYIFISATFKSDPKEVLVLSLHFKEE